MKLVKPSWEILNQSPNLLGVFKQIEIAGRTCYKSEDKITETSSSNFVERMIKSGHNAMLEHGTIYLVLDLTLGFDYDCKDRYFHNKYSKVVINDHIAYVTTNYRVLVENNWTADLKYLRNASKFHEKRISVKFVCDRGVSHEFVRHRVFSFAQESTRYCNYSKDKFDNNITYVTPCWLDQTKIDKVLDIVNKDNKEIYKRGHDLSYSLDDRAMYSYLYDMSNAEHGYFFQISAGWLPQQARSILPNSLKTELVMTGFVSDWKHFFSLRDHQSAHPQAKELAEPLNTVFKTLYF